MRNRFGIVLAALLLPLLGGCAWPFLDEDGMPLPAISIFGSPLPERHDIPYESAPRPTFGSPTSTADGFTVQITNFDLRFNWVLAATSGSVSLLDGGLIYVSGLGPQVSATVTVTAQQYNYYDASATVTGTSLPYEIPEDYSTQAAGTRAVIALPSPAQLGSSVRNWRRVKPSPSCAVAAKCRTAAFGSEPAGQPLTYFEGAVAAFRTPAIARAQYSRLVAPFAGTQQLAQRRKAGFRFSVIGGLGSLQLPTRDIGTATEATLAVLGQRGRYLQLAVVTGDVDYLAGNARALLAGRASRMLIRLARQPSGLKPPLGLALP